MNTKLVMTMSAIVMVFAGVALTFLPQEISALLSFNSGSFPGYVMLQVLGALYFSFGMINWTAKANLIGGIYGRPIAIGNLCHFTIGGLALLKAYFNHHEIMMIPFAIIYVIMGVMFGIIFFRHPVQEKTIQ